VPPLFGWFRKLLFGIPKRDWTFDRRGFPDADPIKRRHLEHIIRVFVGGFHTTLHDGRPEKVFATLAKIEPEFRGFAYEGAGLCLAAFDIKFPWKRNRWSTFQKGLGDPQSFLLHVGYGLALAQLGRKPEEALQRLASSEERWLAIDGYGFHQGYFHWKRFVEEKADPPGLTGFARRVFDHGLGRVLWFGCGADVERVVRTVATFPAERRSDLWCGLGVAATFAGAVRADELRALGAASNGHEAHFKQGCVFAAKLRHRAGTVVPHTELACEVLAGLSVDEAVRMADTAFEGLPPDGEVPAYEALRLRVQHQLASTRELAT
jgi:hypothetical protein